MRFQRLSNPSNVISVIQIMLIRIGSKKFIVTVIILVVMDFVALWKFMPLVPRSKEVINGHVILSEKWERRPSILLFSTSSTAVYTDTGSVPGAVPSNSSPFGPTFTEFMVSKKPTAASPAPLKKVFYYDNLFGIKWKYNRKFFKGRLSCPGEIECIMTCNESDYLTSDAVIIHGQAFQHGLPQNRPPNQKWVYLNRECPKRAFKWYNVTNVIDLTMSYISSADIVFVYGEMLKGNYSGGFDRSRNYLNGKTKSAVIVMTHCVDERTDYIHALSKFIDIDVYGGCGPKPLCHKRKCWDLLRHYKFYLAFENNICVDYVTEKLYFNSLIHGLVPVVIGGANYSDPSVAPQGGYINARDFSTVKELADFMSRVGSDPQLYNQYFHWHSEYTVNIDVFNPALCRLCTYLQHERPTKRYENVTKWYEEVSRCKPYLRPL